MDHKKKTERRLKNLEAIASEKDEESTSNSKQIEAPKQDITMDDHDTEEQKSSAGAITTCGTCCENRTLKRYTFF
ncbi:MAG: hypothetical protein U5J63_04365 [Fodinibius sp.]|nr:hypothetical protein [Fodinibius sp.]